MVLGGVVRVTGSGLGCPDWPLCYGKILPPWEFKAVIEYSHRLTASALVGPLVLGTCIAAWITHRQDGWIVVPATVAIVLLIGQALLGGVTVLNELPGGVVAAHMALAQALLGTLILLLVVSYRRPLLRIGTASPNRDDKGLDKLPMFMLAAAAAVYGLMLTGSYVTAAGATSACSTWPLCQGSLFPETGPQAIHMGHRLATLVFGFYILYALHLGFRGKDRPWVVKSLAMAASIILMLQVAVGAATIWLDFAASIRALHLSLATALWGCTVGLATVTQTYPNDDPSPETLDPSHA